MSSSALVKISPEVEAVLRRSTVRDNVLYLPNEQLDRKLYEAVNKVLGLLGGVWKSGKIKGHVFPADVDPGLALEEALDSGELLDAKKHFQFFPTPDALADVVVEAAGITEDTEGVVFEPHIGSGSLARAALRVNPRLEFYACEIQDELRDKLRESDLRSVVSFLGRDFLQVTVPEDAPGFTHIIANPPFTKGQAVAHCARLLDFLAPGGRMGIVMPASFTFASDRATTALRERVNSHPFLCSVTPAPDGAFAESGTLVRTVILSVTRMR